MDRHQLDHLLGTFCHLDEARTFHFDSVHALLCHRCTSIYSTFLLVWLLSIALKWQGQILQFRTKTSVGIIAIGLLTLCGIQVGLQEFFPPLGGGENARIVAGSLVAFGLFQLSMISRENFPLSPGTPTQLLVILGATVLHLFLIQASFYYNGVTTVLGLIWLYHQINYQVLEGWLENKKPLLQHSVIALFIFLEWGALYSINVLKIHV